MTDALKYSRPNRMISAVICTYNRADCLAKALKSLMVQSLAKDKYEIIVVDNNSTDKTKETVDNIGKKSGALQVRYVKEKYQGLGYARNKGLQCARGKYVAFLDDDAIAAENWLESGMSYFKRVLPKPLAVGGQIKPLYETEKPAWFRDCYEHYWMGDNDKFLEFGQPFSASNMFFRKKYLDLIGGFPVNIGMRGDSISVGEETQIFNIIWNREGHKKLFYYSPNLIVHHTVPSYKMTVSYRLKRSYAGGQSLYIMNRKNSSAFRLSLFMKYSILFLSLPLLLIVNLYKVRYPSRWITDTLSPIAYALGFISAFSGFYLYMKRG